MRRYRQTLGGLVELLSPLDASWKDAHSEEVLRLVNSLPQKSEYTPDDLASLLDDNFVAALTTIRLALDLSKDQFTAALTEALGPGRGGAKGYQHERRAFLAGLESLGASRSLTQLASTPVTWRDVLVERLKSG